MHDQVTEARERLDFIWLEITGRCNLECVHCYADSSPARPLSEGMELEDWMGALDEAAGLGCRRVQFIGGEPTLHPGLPRLIEHARGAKYEEVCVYTNGTHFTEAVKAAFVAHGASLAFSVYGSSGEVHDRIAQRRGSFEKTHRAIRWAVEAGLAVRAGVVEMAVNAHDMPGTRRMLEEAGVHAVNVDRLRGLGRGSGERPGQPKLKELCGRCGSGKVCVSSSGEIYPCVFARFAPLGHIRESGLGAAFAGAPLREFREALLDSHGAARATRQRAPLNRLHIACVPEEICTPDDRPPDPTPKPGDCNPETPPGDCNPEIPPGDCNPEKPSWAHRLVASACSPEVPAPDCNPETPPPDCNPENAAARLQSGKAEHLQSGSHRIAAGDPAVRVESPAMKEGFRVFDADLHTFEPDDLWVRYLDERFREYAPRPGPKAPRTHRKQASRHLHLRAAADAGYDARSHLQAMDIEGIDVGVLFGTRGRHVQMRDDLDPELADALARAHNDWTRDFCAENPRRLKFAAQIAYHDVGLAVREAERAVERLGAVAVIGNPNPVNGRHVHDPCLEPLWQAIERLGVPLCFHPTGVWGLRDDIGARFVGHAGTQMIANAARNPFELMLAFSSFVIGGVFERHPKLRCGFLEGGCAWLPWWLWRLDDTWEKFPEDADVPLSLRASEYFRRQCYVGADAGEGYLGDVVAAIGDANIVIATDYPHRDSLFPEAIRTLLGREDVSPAAKTKMLWDNAARLYARAE